MESVLITGVARGIGEAAARLFIDRGVSVLGIDRLPPPSDLCLAGFVSADLSDLETLGTKIADLLHGRNQLDALINNAAIQKCGPLRAVSPADFRAVLDVNLIAPLIMVQACLPLLERTKGAVVNVASVHAIATSEGICAYAASKGGLTALTRAMSLELAGVGIRVNAVLPGAVDTEMLAAGLARSSVEHSDAERIEAFRRRHPLGRIGQPDDIARAIGYLADNDRSAFVTGTTLVVDGGVTARLSTETDL